MGEIVPKGDSKASNVRSIKSAGHAGGRRSSRGYDPATGEESRGKGYKGTTRESDTEFDVFALVDERGYRPDRFYTRSVNADGHGERMQVRVPQGIDSQMHAAVAEVPEYKTIHDLIRDAVIHRLEYLQKDYVLGDGARRTLELARLQADMARRAQETEMMQEAVDDLDDKLGKLWEKEDWAMMAEELDQGGEMCDWLRQPYKAKAEGVVGKWKAKAATQLKKMREMED